MTATIAECRENARQEERKFLHRMARSWGELAAEKEREVLSAARSAV